MVIYKESIFYHGKEALRVMAKYADNKNVLMSFFKGLFWSDIFARLTYPWIRGCRNWLLKREYWSYG